MSRGAKWTLAVVAVVAWGSLYVRLQPLADTLAYGWLGLGRATRPGAAVAFFAFEAPKVLMLLLLVVFGVGVGRSFFTPEKTRAILAGERESAGNVLAALLGVPTPFCSCSAVPLFIGFVTTGVPLGVTLSFLIAAPMVNEVALVLLWGLFGWKVAVLYLGTGLVIAIVAGWVIGRMRLERWVESWVYETAPPAGVPAAPGRGGTGSGAVFAPPAGSGPDPRNTAPVALLWGDRLRYGRDAVRDIVGRVWPYVLAGIAVGAAIHGYVPQDFMASIMGRGVWWSVPLAVLIGVPMYSNAAGIIPIVQALLEKGAALGTVLAFMMSVIGLSLPETVILRKVLRPQLIATFVGVVAVGILIVGYLFNAVL